MAAFVIFVGGAGTEPDPLPVFFVDSGEHAVRICEGIAATEYRIYKFTCHEVSKSDLSKFPFWTEMTIDARDGVYGEIAAGIYNMIHRAYSIIDQRRVNKEQGVNPNGNTESDGDSDELSSKTEKPTETDDKLPKKLRKDSPSRVGAKAAYDYAMQQIPDAHAMTAVELFDAIREDGEAQEMLPPTPESFVKYLNDCGVRLRKSDTKPTSSSVVRRSDT